MARYNFSKTIVHSGLNKTKTIYGNSRYEIAYKEQIQIKQWEEQWQRKLQIERNRKIAEEKRLERENRAKDDQRAILNAQILTKQAEEQRKPGQCTRSVPSGTDAACGKTIHVRCRAGSKPLVS